MRAQARQFVFFTSFSLFAFIPLLGAPSPGKVYALEFVDVDGKKLSTTDGHITVMVVSPLSDLDKARTVGDRTPEYCLGNPIYRMVTVIRFEKDRSSPVRMVLSALARRRLDAEAKRLQPRYTAKNLKRDPRNDLFAVADFDGSLAAQLEISSDFHVFGIFVFGRSGELLRHWADVPGSDELAAALK